MDANLKVVVSKDDSGLKELLKSLADLQSLFGGAIPAAVEKGAAAMKQSHAKVVESVKQGNAAIIAEATSANEKLKQVTERREQFEKQAEALKFEELKGKYKELVTAHQNAQQAMREATSKEQKAELAEVEKTLKQEKQAYADTLRERPETKKGHASDVGMLGTKREVEGTGKGLMEIAGIGAAAEGLKTLIEKSKEYNDAQIQLKAGTGLAGEELSKQGEDAEKLGEKYAISGDSAKGLEGTISAATHATGDQLNKQSEAILAYATVHKRADQTVEEAANKLMKTYGTNAQLREQIDAESAQNQKKSAAIMNDPAIQMQKVQAQLMDTIGKVSAVVVNALAPALTSVSPILDTVGSLVGTVLKPVLDALGPVVTMVSDALKDMAPPIMELVKAVLGLLEPILIPFKSIFETLLPILDSVIKQVAGSLAPVFTALTPIFSKIMALVGDLANTYLKTYFIPILNILLPIFTDLLVPILQALMPLLSTLTDIVAGVLTPAMKVFGDVMGWIVPNVIQPLVKWLTGTLLDGINQVVGVITKVTSAISSIVHGAASLLGLGDSAADATKDAGKKTLDAQKEANEKSIAQSDVFSLAEIAQLKFAATNHALTQGEINAARVRAQSTHNAEVLHLLDTAQKQLDGQAKKAGAEGAKAAKKAAKDKFTVLREAADEELELEKDSIIESGKTGAEAKAAEMAAEIVHQQAMLDIAEQQYGKASAQFRSAHAKLKQDRQALAEDTKNELIEEGKRNTEAELSELDTRAIKESLTEKQVSEQRFQIVQQGLRDEIAYRRSWGEDVSKLQAQLDQGELKHADELAKARKKIAEDIGKENLDTQRQYLDLERQQLQASGKSTEEIDAQLNRLDQDAEDKRYADELASRKDDLADVQMGHALKESLDANHQGKLSAIQKKGYDAQLAADKEKISWLTGPLSQAFAKTGDAINQKFFTPMIEKALGGKNIFSGFISDIVGGLIKTGVTIATQFATNAVLQAAFGAASVATATTTNAGILATAAPAAAAESIATLGVAPTVGSTALLTSMSSIIPALLAFLPGHKYGTDSSPGGWHAVGEEGVEFINMTPGARVVPNSALNSYPISPASTGSHDMFAGHADRIIQAIHSSGNTVATAAARRMTGIPINDQWRAVQNNSAKAEDRRSF